MVIFHCYVSLPEGTWTLLLNQGVLISFTWNLNCSRASGCIYSIYIVFIVCLCVSYWVLTRISMDWPLMIAKIEKTYPHDIPRIFPGYHHHSPSYPIQNSHFPRFSSTKTTSFRPFPWPCGPVASPWYPCGSPGRGCQVRGKDPWLPPRHPWSPRRESWRFYYLQWIGLRENLQENIDFPIKYGVSCKFSLKPIHWYLVNI